MQLGELDNLHVLLINFILVVSYKILKLSIYYFWIDFFVVFLNFSYGDG